MSYLNGEKFSPIPFTPLNFIKRSSSDERKISRVLPTELKRHSSANLFFKHESSTEKEFYSENDQSTFEIKRKKVGKPPQSNTVKNSFSTKYLETDFDTKEVKFLT